MATLLALLLSLFASPTYGRAPSFPQDSLGARLDRQLGPFLEERVAADQFSGVVVVARRGAPIFSRAYGDADATTHRRNTLDTRFNLGSADKMFTAVAIAQLVDQGRVALDTPFLRYLPGYPNRSVAERVTIRELLSHTSGLGSYFTPAFLEARERVRTVADIVPFFVNDSLQFSPGSRFAYSNAGFVVLGLVIEHVSGESYYDYVERHIFRPAGMTHTGFPLVDSLAGGTDYAIGYTHSPAPDGRLQPGPRVANTRILPERRGSPAGGGYSTAGDLIAFSRALWSGRLIPLTRVREFTRGTTRMGPMLLPVLYGLGFGDLTLGDTHAVGHNGGAPGVNAEFDMYPDKGFDVVVLANYDPPAATAVIIKIREIITGVSIPLPGRRSP